MKNIKTINEFFGGDGSKHIDLTEDETKFLNYLHAWRFKHTMRTLSKPSKILGITYKKSEESMKEITYNDFSLRKKTDNGIMIDSGAGGTFRPEGYMWGSEESNKKITNRLKEIVDSYNNEHKTNLTVSRDRGYNSVSGF